MKNDFFPLSNEQIQWIKEVSKNLHLRTYQLQFPDYFLLVLQFKMATCE
jgi:hypothetical protein